jgi:hypothetical protein
MRISPVHKAAPLPGALWTTRHQEHFLGDAEGEQPGVELGGGADERPHGGGWFCHGSEVQLGLRYGSNLVDAVNGDIITVTTRGWYSQLDYLYGREPAAVWAADAA